MIRQPTRFTVLICGLVASVSQVEDTFTFENRADGVDDFPLPLENQWDTTVADKALPAEAVPPPKYNLNFPKRIDLKPRIPPISLVVWDETPSLATRLMLHWSLHDLLPCRDKCYVHDWKTLPDKKADKDAFIFGDHDVKHSFCNGKCLPRHDKPWIYLGMEPNTEHNLKYSWFQPDVISTYDLTSDLPVTYGMWQTGTWPAEPAEIDEYLQKVQRARSLKQYLASVFVDDCSDRTAKHLAERLMKYSKEVKAFGTCVYKDNPNTAKTAGAKYQAGQVDSKLREQRNSRFCFIIEKSTEPHYLSEKLPLALQTGCVPVYWGDGQTNKVLPDSAYIDARQFKTTSGLMAFLQMLSLDDERYNAYHDWRSDQMAMQNLRDYLDKGLFWYPCRLCEYVRELKEAGMRDPNMTVIKSNYTVKRSTSEHLVTNMEQMARPVPRLPTNQEAREANHPEWKKRKYAHRKEPLTRREQIHRDMLIRLQPKYSRLDMPQKIRKGYEKE